MGRSWDAASTEAGACRGKKTEQTLWSLDLPPAGNKAQVWLAKASTDFFPLGNAAVQIKLQPTSSTIWHSEQGVHRVLMNKQKTYRFWLSVPKVIFFGMKSRLEWIFKPSRSWKQYHCGLCNIYLELWIQEMPATRIPFQMACIISYYLKEAELLIYVLLSSCLSSYPVYCRMLQLHLCRLVPSALSTSLVHVSMRVKFLTRTRFVKCCWSWFSILLIN